MKVINESTLQVTLYFNQAETERLSSMYGADFARAIMFEGEYDPSTEDLTVTINKQHLGWK